MLDKANILFSKHCLKIDYVAISNNGVFAIGEYKFGANPNGIFSIYRIPSQLILQKKFKVNIFNLGISDDGHYAVLQVYEKLILFDVELKAEIGKRFETNIYQEYNFPLLLSKFSKE